MDNLVIQDRHVTIGDKKIIVRKVCQRQRGDVRKNNLILPCKFKLEEKKKRGPIFITPKSKPKIKSKLSISNSMDTKDDNFKVKTPRLKRSSSTFNKTKKKQKKKLNKF